MPRLEYTFDGDAFADGAGGDKFLIDLTEGLSAMYGKLVRQGSVVKVRGVDIRIKNPNEGLQDQNMSVAGKLLYFHPTLHRKNAWKTAFRAWLDTRKASGINSRGADFRVGLYDGYSTDVGLLNNGVKFNAWIDDEEEPLMLASSTSTSDIFGIYTANHGVTSPDTTHRNYGSPYARTVEAVGDDPDFVTNESQYYVEGDANRDANTIPFQLGFGSWWDDFNTDPADFNGVSNAERITTDFMCMCGLIGVYVDTTTVDDSAAQTQEWSIEISVDVESWSPMLPKKKRSRKGGKN